MMGFLQLPDNYKLARYGTEAPLKLEYYPESDILLQEAKPITNLRGASGFADVMLEAMYEWEGVGLAAPQVGLSLQAFVIGTCGHQYVAFNPKIVGCKMYKHRSCGPSTISDEFDWDYEGCLSLPGIQAKVPRWKEIDVEYQDPDGKKCEYTISGFEARVFQHEFDHLRGWLFPFYLIPDAFKPNWKPMVVKPWDFKKQNLLEAFPITK